MRGPIFFAQTLANFEKPAEKVKTWSFALLYLPVAVPGTSVTSTDSSC